MDGVPGISQCPIPPGGTFTYTFIADLYGTSKFGFPGMKSVNVHLVFTE